MWYHWNIGLLRFTDNSPFPLRSLILFYGLGLLDLWNHGGRKDRVTWAQKVWPLHFLCHQPECECGDPRGGALLHWSLPCLSVELAPDSEKRDTFSTWCGHKHLFICMVGTTMLRHSLRYVWGIVFWVAYKWIGCCLSDRWVSGVEGCTCVWVCCINVCACTLRPEVSVGGLPQLFSKLFSETLSHLIWMHQLGRLASCLSSSLQHWDSRCVSPQWLFNRCWGSEFRASRFCG